MARRKRNAGGGGGGRRPRPRQAEDPLDPVLNRRAMESVMQQLIAQMGGQTTPPDSPLGRAQDLMFQAWREPDPAVRERMAREALALCPDCADACVLLAEQTDDRQERVQLYEQGMAAGERALGPERFARDAGHFWGVLETRPYMRARLGLAHCLWDLGRRDEAVNHLQEMLRLNPGDNQGVRYVLAGWLLFLDRDEELGRLLEQYPDTLAAWAYTRALLTFRQQGDTPQARRELKEAVKRNKHVPDYVTGEKFPPLEAPGAISPGQEDEALDYVHCCLPGWRYTPGAVAWLREVTGPPAQPEPEPQGPLSLVKKWLVKNLPQETDVWQGCCRQLPGWVRVAGRMIHPWVVMVTSDTQDLVLQNKVEEKPASPEGLWDVLVAAMRQPAAGFPHRPTVLQVPPAEGWDSLRQHLEEVGVELEEVEELDHLEAAYEDMCGFLYKDEGPGLLDMPGVTPERAGEFFAAAAAYFRQMPWKAAGEEAAVEVRWVGRASGPWYAVPMGQSGLTLGLAMYENLAELRRQWRGGRSERDNARDFVATSLTYEEPWHVPVKDLAAATRYGWEIAREDAYPSVFHKERGLNSRPPLAWELQLLEACLRAVPEFVRHRRREDAGQEEMTVPAGGEEVVLRMRWVRGEDR